MKNLISKSGSAIVLALVLFLGLYIHSTVRSNAESEYTEVKSETEKTYPEIEEANILQPVNITKEPSYKSSAKETDIERVLEKYSKDYQVDLPLVMALIKVESEFDPKAISPVGAGGLMQLMPTTARDLGLVVNSSVDERLNPVKNIRAGIIYLKSLMDMFDNPIDAIAAYNVGPGVIHKGLPSNAETLQHVYKVLRQRYLYEKSIELMNCDISDMVKNCQKSSTALKTLTRSKFTAERSM